jgi:hypothetical protein
MKNKVTPFLVEWERIYNLDTEREEVRWNLDILRIGEYALLSVGNHGDGVILYDLLFLLAIAAGLGWIVRKLRR